MQASPDTYGEYERKKIHTSIYKYDYVQHAHESTETRRTPSSQGEDTPSKEQTTELTCPDTNPYNSTETTDDGIYFLYNTSLEKPRRWGRHRYK
jgi:hypothetical protein